MNGLRWGAALLSAALLVPAVSGQGPASAAIPASTGLDWTSALHHLSLQRRGVTLSAPGSVSCYAYDVPDRAGDATGGLDGIDYRLSYDCVHHTWTATATTAQPFADSQLGAFEVLFDTDNNLNNNCHGVDWGIVATWVPEQNSLFAASVKFGTNCAIAAQGPLAMSRPTSREISLSWSSWNGLAITPTAFRSVAAVTGSQNPTPSEFDEMPNSGLLQSQLTTLPTFQQVGAPRVGGQYTQIVSGDFNGDRRADMLFYGAGGVPDYVWFGNPGGGTFTSKSIAIWGTYTLIPGDFNGDGNTDLLLYAPGAAPDAVWFGSAAGTFTSKPVTINGSYSIVSADFNGDHRADLLFYAPGTAADYIWYGQSDGTFQSVLAPGLNNPYRLAAGDFNGDGYGDVLLVGPGNAPDHVMQGGPGGHFTFTTLDTTGDYSMLRVGDFNGDGLDDVLLLNPGVGADALYYGTTSSPDLVQGPNTVIDEDWNQAVVVGDFNHDSTADVFFHGPGTFPDQLWNGLRTPTALPATTFGTIAVDPTSGDVFVTSGSGGTTMSVLDSHGRLLQTITGLSGPLGVAFGPSTIFVAMTQSQTIAEFDRTSLAPTGSIDTGTHIGPEFLAYQHGKLWFTYDNGLAVWDPGTNIVSTAATDIGDQPVIASGTDGTDTLFLYDESSVVTIARYDISTGSARLTNLRHGATYDPCYYCRDMRLSPDGAHLIVASLDGVGVLDATTLADAPLSYDGQQSAVAVAATSMRGGWVVSAVEDPGNYDLFLHLASSPSIVKAYAIGGLLYGRGLALSPDGHLVYATSHAGYTTGQTFVNVLLVP